MEPLWLTSLWSALDCGHCACPSEEASAGAAYWIGEALVAALRGLFTLCTAVEADGEDALSRVVRAVPREIRCPGTILSTAAAVLVCVVVACGLLVRVLRIQCCRQRLLPLLGASAVATTAPVARSAAPPVAPSLLIPPPPPSVGLSAASPGAVLMRGLMLSVLNSVMVSKLAVDRSAAHHTPAISRPDFACVACHRTRLLGASKLAVLPPEVYRTRTSWHVTPPREAGGSSPLSSPGPAPVTFTEIATEAFRLIRQTAGIDDAMLYSSLRESVSIRGHGATGEGKGGALFFHTSDRRFVVKTVSNSEAQFLQATLPQLCRHLARNPYSLLLPLCALVKLDISGTVLRAVVMPNLFFPSVDERYDLKGATLGRTLGRDNLHDATLTRKDKDWLFMNKRVTLSAPHARHVAEQLRRDTEFLCGATIMDYSLLLGIRRATPAVATHTDRVGRGDGAQPPRGDRHLRRLPRAVQLLGWLFGVASGVRGRPKHSRLDGGRQGGATAKVCRGCRSDVFACPTSAAGEYALGIIDYLQRYNLKKLWETRLKGIRHDKRSFSAVDPALYARRFLNFMTDSIESVPVAAEVHTGDDTLPCVTVSAGAGATSGAGAPGRARASSGEGISDDDSLASVGATAVNTDDSSQQGVHTLHRRFASASANSQ